MLQGVRGISQGVLFMWCFHFENSYVETIHYHKTDHSQAYSGLVLGCLQSCAAFCTNTGIPQLWREKSHISDFPSLPAPYPGQPHSVICGSERFM